MKSCGVLLVALALFTPLQASAQYVTEVTWPIDRDERQVRLGDAVWVRVSNVKALRDYATAMKKPVTLWIGGRDTKLPVLETNPNSRWMRFRLERNADNREIWSDLLYDPFHNAQREITVGVGPGKELTLHPKGNAQLTLVKAIPSHTVLWLMLLAVFVIFFGWLAQRTDILRNGPPYPEDGERQPYSLGRTQMAWWFVLILAGFVAIKLISGDDSSITVSLLALMGISAGTALGAAALDAKPEAKTRKDALAAVTAAKSALAANPTDPALIAALKAAVRAAKAFESENWFFDILKDETGSVALHRLQIFVWTIVLGVMFITSVAVKLTMPEFSGTLLALMGISGGAYLGFKMPTAS